MHHQWRLMLACFHWQYWYIYMKLRHASIKLSLDLKCLKVGFRTVPFWHLVASIEAFCGQSLSHLINYVLVCRKLLRLVIVEKENHGIQIL